MSLPTEALKSFGTDAKQVVVLAMPGSPAADAADERGLAALAVLRAMGLPTLVGLVQEPNNSLKEKSAAKKRGRALLDREVWTRPRRTSGKH